MSCEKEIKIEIPPINQKIMWDCHHEKTWDSLKTQNTLIGIWEWKYIACFWTPENANSEDFQGLSIEFKSDSTLDVKQDGNIIQTSNWKVVDGDAGLYALEVETHVMQLGGRILFCEDIVEFNDSYIDGCDNYFRRKK